MNTRMLNSVHNAYLSDCSIPMDESKFTNVIALHSDGLWYIDLNYNGVYYSTYYGGYKSCSIAKGVASRYDIELSEEV